ncbi:MAG: DUF58 domain-containing protein [Candidatus Saccharimonas sp.]|nr:DUF58 domain-containing protein [Candidatus Saccharimonas sp.]
MAIYAHERVRGVLVGEYGSVFKGRSMDFDDLREYIPGDDIKDIDWKATARSGATRIRRYIAVRKHNIMLVIDTGRNMTAVTDSGSSKKDTVIMLAGVIGTVALKHGDLVGMVSGDKGHSRYHPLKTGMTHLERLLQVIDTSVVDESDESNIASQLEYVVRNVRRKMIVVVISDEIEFDESVRSVVKRLRAQHEILWLRVSDADLTMRSFIADVEQIGHILPAFIRRNKTVMAAFQREEAENRQKFERELNRMAIATETVSSEEEAVPKVFRLLERHRSARYT